MIKIGAWLFDKDQNLLRQGQKNVVLQPLAAEVLYYLACHSERVISLNELVDRLWEGKIVGDSSVYHIITDLRRALGNETREDRYIQTVRKRGYRLAVPVVTDSHLCQQDVSQPDRRPGQTKRQTPTTKLALCLSLLLATSLGVMAGYWLVNRIDPAQYHTLGKEADKNTVTSAIKPITIAVLPFENLSRDSQSLLFSTGVLDDLITHLAKIRGFKVISRTSVIEYAESNKNIRQISRELGANYILQGTIYRDSENIKINVQLLDNKQDTYVWADSFDQQLNAKSLLAFQSNLAVSIANILNTKLSHDEHQSINIAPTSNTQAYDFYLTGLTHLSNYYMDFGLHDTNKNLEAAYQNFQRAVETDPNFALGWSYVAETILLKNWLNNPKRSQQFDEALRALEYSLHLSPQLPRATLVLATYYLRFAHDSQKALTLLATVEPRMTNSAEFYTVRGRAHWEAGNFQQAIDDKRNAVILSPRYIAYYIELTRYLLQTRDYAQASYYSNKIHAMASNQATNNTFYAHIPLWREGDTQLLKERNDPYSQWYHFFYTRNFKAALAILENTRNEEFGITGSDLIFRSYALGITHQLLGNQSQAESAYRELEDFYVSYAQEKNWPERVQLFICASAAANSGKVEQATDYLEKLKQSTDVDNLDEDKEVIFQILIPLGDMGLVAEALDTYLSHPGGFWSLNGLLKDPRFEQIQYEPEILAVVNKHQNNQIINVELSAAEF